MPRKHSRLWGATVITTPAAEESVAALMLDLLGHPPSSYTDFETGLTTVSVYLEQRPGQWTAQRASLTAGLRVLAAGGLSTGPGRVSLTRLRRQDWAESWKRHFRPIQIGRALFIRPSWSRRRPRAGQAVLVLDPGLSFGTGHHPTTLYCLRQLVAARSRTSAQSVFDLGTGSGILAIAAAKLGFGPIEAVDLDADCLRIARANARRNRVARRIRFTRQDVSKLPSSVPRRFSIICANLITTLLLAHVPAIVARLAPGGRLVLAGILKSEFAQVQKAYQAAGLRLVHTRSHKEWCSGTFERL